MYILAENKMCWQGCRETGTFVGLQWNYKMVQSLWTHMVVLKILNIDLTFNLAICLWVYN